MRCKNCKYFDGNPADAWGYCNNEEIFQDASDFIIIKPTEKTLFRYMDSEQYGASFEVHENFGCVGFRKRHKKQTFEEMFKELNKEGKILFDEMGKILRLEKICDFPKDIRILKRLGIKSKGIKK